MALQRALRSSNRAHRLSKQCRQCFGTTAHVRIAGSTSVPDVSQQEIARLAAQPFHALTLSDLVRHGRPPLSTKALLSSANFALSLIPIRLAHRIQALRNLPFIVVSNPHVARIYQNYMHSLSTLLPWSNRSIHTLDEEIQFTEVMADLVQTHSNTIPVLARGFLECRRYIAPEIVTRFLDEHLRARIGTRLIAEQHIALHLSSQPHSSPNQPNNNDTSNDSSTHIGVIDTALQPAAVVRHCEHFVSEICELRYGVRPRVIINGQPETRIAHVLTHLEYILTELLKNAFRATVERGNSDTPVEVTIAASRFPETKPSTETNADDILSNPTQGVTIRIRDCGGGISPTTFPNIWNYAFTTFNDGDDYPTSPSEQSSLTPTEASSNINLATGIIGSASPSAQAAARSGTAGLVGGSSLAGLGYGLPLGRAYAEHFGGEIGVQSLWGWGTDVYLKLRGLGG